MQPELIGGRYRVEQAIGRGGMGTVWLCRDETLHRQVAVKQVGLLPGESVTDSARALREARSTAALSHRNVVTVFDVVEEEGHIWLVMEYVPGRSLSEIIKQDGPLDPATAAEIGAQVAAGLVAAHAAGTMHRDVKPGNVLVREDGVAKLSDFGIARTAGDATLTQSGFLTGTPGYFSPELARGADPGPATDVWALGATLYAAVEGRPPYEQQSNPVAVLHAIATDQPPHPQHAAFLEPALQRMMDRDPESRWSTEDAAHVLRRLADSHQPEGTLKNTLPGSVGAVPEEPTSRPAPAPSPDRPGRDRPRRRGPVRLVLAVALLLLVLGGVAWVVSQLGDDDQPNDADPGKTPSQTASQNADAQDEQPASTSSAEAKEEFVRDYFAKAPGGSDEAWDMLGPSLQEQGRESYDSFWSTIESVEVTSAEAREGSNTVEVTLTYRSTDGRVSTERKREGLVRSEDGGYLLDTDVPAG